MRYRAISTQMWGDEKVRRLSERGKLVWVFLLTHPAMTSIGALKGSVDGLADEIKIGKKPFRESFGELLGEQLIEHDDDACLTCVPNFLKHNPPKNGNMVKSWGRFLPDLPECVLLFTHLVRVREFVERLGERLGVPFVEQLPDGIRNCSIYSPEWVCQPTNTNTKTTISPSPDGEGSERTVFDGPRPSGWSNRLEATFDEFWKAYPRKIDKGDARKVWARLKPFAHLEAIHDTLKLQCRSQQWRSDNGKYIPYPAKWLAATGWESTGIDKTRLNGEREITQAELESAFDA